MLWDMKHETKGVSGTNEIETSDKMHSKTIITCKKSKWTNLTKSDKKDLKFNIILKQAQDLDSHNIKKFWVTYFKGKTWESRKINMPKMIRFSSSLCILFHKSISHGLPNTRFTKKNYIKTAGIHHI
jgi:predicted GH43/DUF377 family glycosyl hydrolase